MHENAKNKAEVTENLLAWSSLFIRLSLYDFNQYRRCEGLSLVQMTVLMHLYYQGDSEASHFCDMLQISAAGVSQMIARMVEQGVVQQQKSATDRRVRLVTLTPAGRDIVHDCIHVREAWVWHLVETMPQAEQQMVDAAMKILIQRASQLDVAAKESTGLENS